MNKKKSALISIFSNSFLIALKTMVGILSGSISIISEAVHSISDLFASCVTLFSVSKSDEPADDDHQFGHGKFEDFSGLIEGILILLASFLIIIQAAKRIITGSQEVILITPAIIVMLIAVIVNTFVSLYLFKVAKNTGSIAIFADAEHLRTDVFSSLALLFGLVAIKITHIYILDPLFAVIVGILILNAGYKIVRECINNLLDGSLPQNDIKSIKQIIESFKDKGILSYKRIKTRKAGIKKIINLDLFVNKELSISAAHNICDEIEAKISEELGVTDVTIHLEPNS